MSQFLYGWLVIVGLLDALLVAPALVHATEDRTAGRLLSTLAVLSGLCVAAVGRLFATAPLHPTVAVGLVMIDVGLVGYAIFLPTQGLLSMLRRHR